MKMKELLETPIGVMAHASVQRHPELETFTPDVAKKLHKWAQENDYPIEYVICALTNWLVTFCDDASQPQHIN